MPLNQGIVGHVATTGEMMNVKDVYEWVKSKDEALHFSFLAILFFIPKLMSEQDLLQETFFASP